MANYIGSAPRSGEFKKLDAIASLFNGSTTEFALKFNGVSVQVGDATQLMVSINGVIQEPLVSYTLGTGGSKIVFLTPPPVNASCFITLFGGIGGTVTPSDSSVTVAKLVPSLAADINAKALATDVTSALALKADTSTVTSALALKADQTTVDTSLALKADKTNVLALNNTTAYSPTSNYHPATKGYVDALASTGGGNVSITKGYTFTGTGAQTTFDCGAANSYILGAVDVYHNGMQLDGSDYTAADGRNFTLTSLTPASGDIIKLVAYGGADVYNKTQTNTLLDAKANLGGANFTGQTNITAVGQVSTLTSTNSFASGYNDVVQILAPNQTGGGLSLNIGKSASTRNLGKMAFMYNSSGSQLNKLSFGFFDADGLLNVDAGGRITHPNQPAFFARYSNGSFIIGSGDLIFDSDPLNIGGHYSKTTGLFTAPVAGTYWFTAVMQHYGGNGNSSWANIVINGSIYRGLRMEAPATSNYQTNSVSGAVYLNAGDNAKVYCAAANIFWSDHTSFSGYLIG